jgi:hypothetical protein
MSLDTSKHRCLSCCTTNITTDDCCQCPSIWDGNYIIFFSINELIFSFQGFCLHPLVSASTYSSNWWLIKSPIDNIRNKFSELNHSRQTVVLVILFVVLVTSSIIVISIGICYFTSFRFPSISISRHNNSEYIMLEDFDNDEVSNENISNQTTIPLRQVEQT